MIWEWGEGGWVWVCCFIFHDSAQDYSSMGSYNLMVFWLKISMPGSADEISQNNRYRMWQNFCFSKVSYSVRRTFNQPTETSFLLLDFSFRKDLVHYAAQIVLFLVTPVLFRLSAADITLPGPLEHHLIYRPLVERGTGQREKRKDL